MLFTIFKCFFLFQRYSSFLNMQISQVMMSYTQPNSDQIWWKKYQKCLILCSKILLSVLHNLSLTVLLPWQHTRFQTSPISGHLWRSIFIFPNSASSTGSNKHINMLAWVCGLVWCFSSWKSLTYWNQVGGDWKRVSCHSNKMLYSQRCVFYRTTLY